MQTDDADKFLVEAIRRGDQRAWHQLIERYQGRLLAFARTRLGRGGDAEDALQETLMGFVTSLKHFDDSRSLETYLFAILRYKIGEVLTRKARRAEYTTGFDADEEAVGMPEPADGETPSRVALQREASARQSDLIAAILRRLIEELRDRGKLEDLQVIELLFYVGLRNKEAGERLGRDEKSVAGVKFRALTRLREFHDEMEAAARGLLNEADLSNDATISQTWRQRRLSCLKRSTIGSYLLGVLEEPWLAYTRFHLDEVQCLMCRANVEDLSQEGGELASPDLSEQMFQSSVGFLSRGGSS
jgi:RNA polymerase sigma-70 factor (ECF subfamily)